MAKRFVLPKRVVAEAEVGRRTAGLPSVDPLKRAISDAKGYKAEYQDALVKEAETNAYNAVRPDGDRPRTFENQLGKPMTGWELKSRLLKLNPALKFYLNAELMRLVIKVKSREPEYGEEVMVSSCPVGMMPEFDVPITKMVKRYNKETGQLDTVEEIDERNPLMRGWRTVLAACIKGRLIGPEAIFKEFGPPSHDSERWAAQIGNR